MRLFIKCYIHLVSVVGDTESQGEGALTLTTAKRNTGAVAVARGGGGYSVWKRVPTAVCLLESSGYCDPWWLKKKGGGLSFLSYCRIWDLSESVLLIFHIK